MNDCQINFLASFVCKPALRMWAVDHLACSIILSAACLLLSSPTSTATFSSSPIAPGPAALPSVGIVEAWVFRPIGVVVARRHDHVDGVDLAQSLLHATLGGQLSSIRGAAGGPPLRFRHTEAAVHLLQRAHAAWNRALRAAQQHAVRRDEAMPVPQRGPVCATCRGGKRNRVPDGSWEGSAMIGQRTAEQPIFRTERERGCGWVRRGGSVGFQRVVRAAGDDQRENSSDAESEYRGGGELCSWTFAGMVWRKEAAIHKRTNRSQRGGRQGFRNHVN
jgi:hypothetical protein